MSFQSSHLAQVSALVLILLDRELRIRAMTPSARDYIIAIWGLEPSIGDAMLDYGEPNTVAGFNEKVAEAFTGRRVSSTRTVTFPSGPTLTFDVNYDPVPGPDGQVSHVLFGAVDVSELHQIREERRLRERALAQIAEGVLIADATQPSMPIVYANDAVSRITGYRREDFKGRNCRFLNDGNRDQPGLDRVREALRRQEPVRVQVENRRADGSWFWNELLLSPIHDEAGRLTHYLGIQRDVSEERALQEQAARADRLLAVEAGASSVVHDLNNLLTVVDLGLEDAAASTQDGALQAQLASLRDVIASGALMARRGLKGGTTEPGDCDVAGLLRRRSRLLRRLLEGRGSFVLDVPLFPVRAPVSPSVLDQVVTNLVTNAADALTHGGTVVVSLATRGTEVIFTVADDGVGIPPSLRARLFEPMSTSKSHGTGLGLTSVQRLVDGTGGHIEVDSEPGRTCFTVSWPWLQTPGEDPASAASILYLEDDAMISRLLVAHLSDAGHEVRHASRVEEATVALTRTRPDLLVTDAYLPDGSGIALAKLAREKYPGLGVVVVTGDTRLEVPPWCVRVAKPFGLVRLDEAIAAALRPAPSEEAPPAAGPAPGRPGLPV